MKKQLMKGQITSRVPSLLYATDQCIACEDEGNTIQESRCHILVECPSYNKIRDKLLKKLMQEFPLGQVGGIIDLWELSTPEDKEAIILGI